MRMNVKFTDSSADFKVGFGKEAALTEAGYLNGLDTKEKEFWGAITQRGARKTYASAFANWDMPYIRPTYKIIPTSNTSQMFIRSSIKKLESAYFDLSQIERAATDATSYYYTCYNCTELEEIEDIGISPDFSFTYTFANCKKLHTIAKITLGENDKMNNVFTQCNNLKNIRIEGTIGQSVSFAWSPLTVESMKSIISCLKNYSGTDKDGTYTISFSSACWASLGADSTAPDGNTWKDYVKYTLGWAI